MQDLFNINDIPHLPVDIQESIEDVEVAYDEFKKNNNKNIYHTILKERIYDLHLACKTHRVLRDIDNQYLDSLEDYYWKYL